MALVLGAGLAFHAHDNLFGFQGRKIALFVRRCDRVRNGTGPCCYSCTRRMPRIGTDRDVGRFHRSGCRTLRRECWWFGTRKWHDHRVGKWLSVHQRLVLRRRRSQHAVRSCKRRSSRSYRQCVTHGRIPHDSRSVHLRERRGMQSMPKQYLRMKNSSLNRKLPQTMLRPLTIFHYDIFCSREETPPANELQMVILPSAFGFLKEFVILSKFSSRANVVQDKSWVEISSR